MLSLAVIYLHQNFIMKKINKHIEIVRSVKIGSGGMSRSTSDRVFEVLSAAYKSVGVSIITDEADLEALVMKKPDLVFLGSSKIRLSTKDNKEFSYIWLSEYLEQQGISYTGSGKLAMETNSDKELAKFAIFSAGLPTSAYFTALPGEHDSEQSFGLDFPLFIKPISSGGSKGIDMDSVVHNSDSFNNKVKDIFEQFGTKSLVESYLTGREYSVALLGNGGNLKAMPIELLTQKNSRGDRILCSAVKKEDKEQVVAVTNQALKKRLAKLAKQIFMVLGARDYGRVDFRMDGAGKIHFLEANLAPGLGGGYFTRACSINGVTEYADTILTIARLGLGQNDLARSTNTV